MSVAVVGNVFVDIKGFPDDIYIPAGRNAGSVITVHGGVGRNVAEDIGNLGLHPKFISMVDETGTGADVVSRLNDHEVDTNWLIRVHDGMGIWLAIFDNKGDVSASISKRPSMDSLAEMIKTHGDEIFADADSVVLEIDVDEAVVESVFSFAEKYSVPVYALVANMSIASKRRDYITRTDCFICNLQEAEILFVDNFDGLTPEELCAVVYQKILSASIKSIVVTLGADGCVYADLNGNVGTFPAIQVNVRDTTGAGDAFCAGTVAGLTYGKSLKESVAIGTRLAASVISVTESTCPRFKPEEFGLSARNSLT